jgi:hypothetical protein
MKNTNRDLLVLVKDPTISEGLIEMEIKQLNYLLTTKETFETFCQVSEVFDINKNKLVTRLKKIKALLSTPELTHFVFILNKN